MLNNFTYLIIMLYAVTLIYFTVTERVKKYILFLIWQGILLFFLALITLHNVNVWILLFVLIETIGVKSFLIPWVLHKVRKHNDISRISEARIPLHYSLFIVFGAILLSFIGSFYVYSGASYSNFLAISVATFFTGFLLIHIFICNF